jgi:primosomal protein N'
MFFAVLPFSHSIGVEPLIYHGGEIQESMVWIGSIVEIPYGKNLEFWIISDTYVDSPIDTQSEAFERIKTIHRIVTEKQLLDIYQIQLILKIAKKYMIPIHRILGIFLPRPVLSRLEKKNYEQLIVIPEKPGVSQKQEAPNNGLHIVSDSIVTPDLVERYINWSTVIILPDDFAMIPYEKVFWDDKNILFLKNDMTDTKKAQAWIDIRNWVFPIIYWTRKIIYYNLARYSNILYIEDSLGPDYWHYPIKIQYNDILHIFMEKNNHQTIQVITSVPTLMTLNRFRAHTIHNIFKSPWNKI